MRYLILLLFLPTIVNCGVKADVRDSTQTVQGETTHTVSGETTSTVVVELAFIEQIRQICDDSIALDEPNRVQLAAQCTLDNLDLLAVNFGGLDELANTVCSTPPTGLTAEQLSNYQLLCGSVQP